MLIWKRLPAVLLCAVAAATLFLSTGSASAQVVLREGRFGDRITGEIAASEELDYFVDRALAGSVLSVKIGPGKKSPYRAALLIYTPESDFDPLDAPGVVTKKGAGFSLPAVPLPVTGRYRLLVFARLENEVSHTGTYELRTKIRPPKRVYPDVFAPGSDSAAEAGFDALEGMQVQIRIRAGPDEPLPTLADLRSPSGASLLAGAEVKTGRTSTKVKLGSVPEFGAYRVLLDGPGAGAASVEVKLKAAKTKGRILDVSDGGPVAADPVLPVLVSGDPYVILPGESGGPADFPFLPAPDAPLFVPPVGATWEFENIVFDEGDEPKVLSFDVVFDPPGYGAQVSGITRDGEGKLTGFTATVDTPEGAGETVFSAVTYDGSDRLTGYTELRTQPGGRAFTIAVYDVDYPPGRTRFRTDVTGPEGDLGSFSQPAWRLPPE